MQHILSLEGDVYLKSYTGLFILSLSQAPSPLPNSYTQQACSPAEQFCKMGLLQHTLPDTFT